MAQFPCSRCGKRYRGPQQTAYPAIVDGSSADRQKERLCPTCFRAVEGWVQERLVPGNDPTPVTLCSACGLPDPTLAVFVTLYRAGQDREDWFGRLHTESCLIRVHDALFSPGLRVEP